MNNMKFYDYGRSVPEVAMKPINAGLKRHVGHKPDVAHKDAY